MKRIGLLSATLIAACAWAGAQTGRTHFIAADSPEGIELQKFMPLPTPSKSMFVVAQSPMEVSRARVDVTLSPLYEYLNGYIDFKKKPYYDDKGELQDSYDVIIEVTANVPPINVKYSLYAFRTRFNEDGSLNKEESFSQDGKRGYLQGCRECGLVTPLTTQADIAGKLDKIYEFGPVLETITGYRTFEWDGLTDPKFTGKKYAVNDCGYLAAHNSETGELLGLVPVGLPTSYGSAQLVNYAVKDDKGKDIPLTANIALGFDDKNPIKKITVLLTGKSCGWGGVSYATANKGVEAMIADINSRSVMRGGDILAYAELTNPTDLGGGLKLFEWSDIKKINWNDKKWKDILGSGWEAIPNLDGMPPAAGEYKLAYIIEADYDTVNNVDIKTVTGINNMAMSDGKSQPVPQSSYTGIESPTVISSGIKIGSAAGGFAIVCPAGIAAQRYTVYDLVGRRVKTGALSGASEETIAAPELRNGIYFVRIAVNDNGTEQVVGRKVVKK